MLLIPTKLAPSAIHGMGIFAEHFIPKGTCLWQFAPGLDIVIPEAEVDSLPAEARDYVIEYGYLSEHFGPGYVLNFDHSRFLNHSAEPNTDNLGDKAYALRDIQPGEEITCDYRELSESYTALHYVGERVTEGA